jgi:hypothetical protein
MANGLYQIIIEKLDKRFLMMNFLIGNGYLEFMSAENLFLLSHRLLFNNNRPLKLDMKKL